MPDFEVGDLVRAVESYAYRVTSGKVYEVIEVIPGVRSDWFRYSEYVVVIDDYGRRATFHTRRFEKAS